MKTRTLSLAVVLVFIFAGCGVAQQAPGDVRSTGTAPAPPTPLSALSTTTQAGPNDPLPFSQVSFDEIAPPGMDMQQSWNAMGMDDRGRIYIGFTSQRRDGRDDFPVFRYDPKTGKKELLGTFLDIVAAAGNSKPGEGIPKGHTRMIFADGKMYMASQSFHDLKQEIDSLATYRGSHLFAFDTAAGTWQDLSASLPNGVVTEHEGIVSLNIFPKQNLLVGLAHPSSDIVFFDYKTNRPVKIVPGIPWKLGNPLSREVIVAPSGNIYTYRGTEQARQRNEIHTVWVYNLQTGVMKDTGFPMTQGFWIGQTKKRDGSKIYINTTGGELYEFDAASETFKDLGYELPVTDKRIISNTYAVTLSPDETKIYYVLSVIQQPSNPDAYDGSGGSGELYFYDLGTRRIVFVQQLPRGIYTSADVRDGDNIYLSHFGTSFNIWSGKPGLFILHIPPQT